MPRITESPGSCPPANDQLLTQTYTFDPFGNLQAIGVNNARNTPTNRLTGGGYDAAGNLGTATSTSTMLST